MDETFESLYFKILQYLANREIGVETDISFLVKDRYIKTNKADIKVWGNAIGEASSFLSKMKSNGHIEYNYLSDKSELTNLMVKDGTFFASITPDGFVFLQDYKLAKSSIINQKAQTKIFKGQTRLLKGTAAFAFVALLLSCINTCIEVKKYNKAQFQTQSKPKITSKSNQCDSISKP
jgi:hypothetical protein